MSHYKKCIMFYRAMTHGDLNVLVPLLPILAYWLKVKNNDDNLISAVYVPAATTSEDVGSGVTRCWR